MIPKTKEELRTEAWVKANSGHRIFINFDSRPNDHYSEIGRHLPGKYSYMVLYTENPGSQAFIAQRNPNPDYTLVVRLKLFIAYCRIGKVISALRYLFK